MANLTETNTLNDTQYYDRDVDTVKSREEPARPAAGEEYDYVSSFFLSIIKDPVQAGKFTNSLYQVAAFTQTEVLVLLETLQNKDSVEINIVMAYYLNLLRSPATLLGVQGTVRPNYYAGRNVLS